MVTKSLSIPIENPGSIETACRQRVMMRCASLIVQKSSHNCCTFDPESVDIAAGHVAHLGYIAQSIAHQNLENNAMLTNFLNQTDGKESKVLDSSNA